MSQHKQAAGGREQGDRAPELGSASVAPAQMPQAWGRLLCPFQDHLLQSALGTSCSQGHTVTGHFLQTLFTAVVPQRPRLGSLAVSLELETSVLSWSGWQGAEMMSGGSGFTVGALGHLRQLLTL